MKLLFAALIFLTACSSYRRQADDLFAKGDYFAATGMYERALQKDPKDSEAKEGLQRARRALIEERLIEVRQQRLADNYSGALSRLLWIVNSELDWQVSPSGAAFATQEEEVAQLFRWFHEQTRAEVAGKRYLKAKIFTENHRAIFAGGSTEKHYSALTKMVADGGTADCRSFLSNSKTYFAREFALRYCGVWGVSEDKSVKVPPTGLPAFGKIELTGALEELPGDASGLLSDSLLGALKTTPYYKPEAGALKIALKGRFLSRYDEHQTMTVHAYTVQVPYTVTNTVPYTETETYTTYSPKWDPATQTTIQVPTTQHRTVTKYREETETLYRDEPRSFPYMVTEFNLRYQVAGMADALLDGVPYSLPLEDELQLTDRYHDTSNATIGLYARPKKMPAQIDWLRDTFSKSGSSFSQRLAQGWDAKYCKPKNILAATQVEAVMKCLKGTRAQHEFVENWFMNRFGLSHREVQSALAGGASGAQVAGTY